MDWAHFEQLRLSGFTMARRGYDKREVDRFLDSLAEWLENDAATELGDEAVQRKLELVGTSTAHILLTTEKESQELRRSTQAELAELREQADGAAKETRAHADEYAAATRERADEQARRTKEAAAEQARKTVEEGDRRRAAAEAVVAELEGQRDAIVGELEQMRGELLATISAHSTRTSNEPRGGDGRRKRANIDRAEQAEDRAGQTETVEA
jgi:DivIVA domain-containing protein